MTDEVIKVLLIDDDEEDYILTKALLGDVQAGRYQLDWASTYEEGVQVAARREHHVCLVDHRLGVRDGVELIREARESRLTTPMILLTGQGDHDVDVAAMKAGATDYLVKHETSPTRLERTIRYAVQLNIERCREEKALESYARKQTAIVEIGRQALMAGELQELFTEAVSLVARTLEVKFSKVLELVPEGDALVLRAGVGFGQEYLNGSITVSAGKESQAGFTLLSNGPVIVEDLRTETRFSGPPLLHDHGIVSGISAIIRGRKGDYGVLGAHTEIKRIFTLDEVTFLDAVANVLGEAIARKRADEEDVARMIGLNLEIAERKKVEAEMAASETLLKQFVAHTPTAIAMLDSEMRYLEISKRWLTDYGLIGQDIIGKSHYEVFPDIPEKWERSHSTQSRRVG